MPNFCLVQPTVHLISLSAPHCYLQCLAKNHVLEIIIEDRMVLSWILLGFLLFFNAFDMFYAFDIVLTHLDYFERFWYFLNDFDNCSTKIINFDAFWTACRKLMTVGYLSLATSAAPEVHLHHHYELKSFRNLNQSTCERYTIATIEMWKCIL